MSPESRKNLGISPALGRMIAAARMKKNLTQADLARQTHISRNSIARIESGLAGLRRETLERILAIVEIDLDAALQAIEADRVAARARHALDQSDETAVTQELIDMLIRLAGKLPRMGAYHQKLLLNLLNHVEMQADYFLTFPKEESTKNGNNH